MGLSAAVIGASGYVGGEVLRLLGQHPVVTPGWVSTTTRVGEPLVAAHPHLAAGTERFVSSEAALAADADLCISCLPHGALAALIETVDVPVIVDVSADHRADDTWVYGLTEFARAELNGATRIANPGCYPTALLLALMPFVKAGLVTGAVIVDALSGVSGAGRNATPGLMFGEMHSNARAYGTTTHRHVAEMERQLSRAASNAVTVSFTPHLVPIARGLLVTARAALSASMTDDDALEVLHDAYRDEIFVSVSAEWPQTKAVTGGNGAIVSARVDAAAGMLVASAAIDNLGKGAAGQAIQNANVALGLDEAFGLTRDGLWP